MYNKTGVVSQLNKVTEKFHVFIENNLRPEQNTRMRLPFCVSATFYIFLVMCEHAKSLLLLELNVCKLLCKVSHSVFGIPTLNCNLIWYVPKAFLHHARVLGLHLEHCIPQPWDIRNLTFGTNSLLEVMPHALTGYDFLGNGRTSTRLTVNTSGTHFARWHGEMSSMSK